MKLFFTNKVYHFLTVSRFLNTIGSSLYNIVFVIYAATVFHSKIMVGVANVTMVIPALSFMLSALVILIIKDDADYDVLSSDNELSFKEQFSNLYHNVMLIFNETNSADFIHLLLAILCLNMLSGSLNAIYNIWLLFAKIGHLSYSQALLLIEFILVGGILIGSLTPHDYFSQKSIRQLLKISAVIFSNCRSFKSYPLPLNYRYFTTSICQLFSRKS